MYRLTVIDTIIAPQFPWKKILLCAKVMNSSSHIIVLHTLWVTFFVFLIFETKVSWNLKSLRIKYLALYENCHLIS